MITKFKKRISDSLDTKILGAKLFFNKSAIVVYQMGKVGSTTVYYSLKKQLPLTPVFHVHCLSENTLKEQEKSYYKIGKTPRDVKHLRQGKFLNEQLNKFANINWKIVTLVREPIIREISIFFQQRDRNFPNGINTIDIISIIQKKISKF